MVEWNSDLDSLTDDAAIAFLRRKYPGWECWRGVNRRCYARLPLTSPPVVLHGEDWTDLNDEISRARSRLANGDTSRTVLGFAHLRLVQGNLTSMLRRRRP